MKLYHCKCGSEVTIMTTKLMVTVLDIMVLSGEISSSLLDISENKDGENIYLCSCCGEVPEEELGMRCTQCDELTPLKEMYNLQPNWTLICKKSYDRIVEQSKMANPDFKPIGGLLNPVFK
jgi:hypothetical protein